MDDTNNNNIDSPPPESYELDVIVRNITVKYDFGMELDLKDIEKKCNCVEFKQGRLFIRFKTPAPFISLTSKGCGICMGTQSIKDAKKAILKVIELLHSCNLNVCLKSFLPVNISATTLLPWRIHIQKFAERNRDFASYEPELRCFVIYKIEGSSINIYASGAITIMARSFQKIEAVLGKTFPRLRECKVLPNPDE